MYWLIITIISYSNFIYSIYYYFWLTDLNKNDEHF